MALCASSFLALSPLVVRAATIVWENTGTTFSTGANWIGGNAPANNLTGDVASFQAATASFNPNLTANRSINGLEFTSGTAAWTFSASGGTRTLTLGSSGIVSNDDSIQTFNNANLSIALGANTAFTSNSTGALFFGNTLNQFNLGAFTLTLNGTSTNTSNQIADPILGTGGITKSGTGTWTLSGANTYTGATAISQGTLQLNANAPSGAAGTLGNATSAVTLNNAGTGANNTALLIGTSGVSVGRNITVANLGTGTTTLGGNIASGTGTFTGNVTLNRTTSLNADGTSTIEFNTGTISGTGGITKTGTGTVLLNTANSSSGTTTVNAGTLAVDGNQTNNRLAASAAVVVNNGGTFEIRGVNAFSAAAPAGFTLNSGGTLNIVSGASANGGTDSHTHLGNLTLAGGTINLSYSGTGTAYNNESAQLDGSVTATADSTIQFGSGATTANAGLALNGSTAFIVNPGVTLSVSAELEDMDAGNNGFTKSGAGTLTLSGTNSYTGVTTINAGTVSVGTIGNGGVAGNLGQATNAAGNLVLGGGTLQYTGATASTNRNFTLTAGTTSSIDVSTGATNLTISGASTNTTGGLTKTGDGTLTLSGANLYTGTTTVSAGTLAYGASNALSSGGVTVNGGTLAMGTFSDTVGAVTLTSGSITGSTGVLTGTSYAMQSGTASAILGGTGALTKTTAGTVSLDGTSANTYTGTTSINDGTLVLNKTAGINALGSTVISVGDGAGAANSATLLLAQSNQIANAAAVTVNSDGLFNVNGNVETIGSIAGSGAILLGTGQLIAGGNNSSTAYSGTLAGGAASIFTKAGSGTLTINSDVNAVAGDFAGTLNLSAGTLAFNVDNAFTGTVNISAGATLRLSNADLTIADLNFTGSGTITLDFSGTASSLNVTNLDIAAGITLNIINWQNAADYFFAANWTGAVVNTTGSSPMNQVVFNSPTWNGNDTKWVGYDSQITPVPEPSTYGALLFGSIGALLCYRRFRKTKSATESV